MSEANLALVKVALRNGLDNLNSMKDVLGRIQSKLVKADHRGLEDEVGSAEKVVAELQELEAERDALVRRFMVLQANNEAATFSALLDYTVDDELKEMRDEYLAIVDDVQLINHQNSLLLTQALQVMDFTIGAILNERGRKKTYDKDGRVGRGGDPKVLNARV